VTYPQQQGGYGPPPAYPQPPNKPKTGLIVGIVGGVVAVALGLVLVLTLTGDDDDKPGTAGGGGTPPGGGIPDPTLDYTATDDAPPPGGGADSGPGGAPGSDSAPDSGGPTGSADPWELVQTVARIFETNDVDALQDYACGSRDRTFFEKDLEQFEGAQVKAEAKDLNETSPTEAEATIALTVDGVANAYPILVKNENGVWCANHKWAN
jgi:hypothetical protein